MSLIQTEKQLEDKLFSQLVAQGYEPAYVHDTESLHINLKKQLEKFNNITLTDDEFESVLNYLDYGSVFDKAVRLRDRFPIKRDDGTINLRFINMEQWCKNEYQVARQITQLGTYENRYDVTILINGLPLVQIELKRNGVELKEAFNQIQRYHKHSFAAGRGLFQYVQIFVISNGVNTKYYSNNKNQSFKFTFYWTDVDNNRISTLDKFTELFLEKCHLSKVITKYMVLSVAKTDEENQPAQETMLVLRPYQYYAVEAIEKHIKESKENGYIWHTTGSGKTLTSFKASQIINEMPEVDKVFFVVDRRDLDYQTAREFNHYSKGGVDYSATNTKRLVEQITDTQKADDKFKNDTKLIVTTIQKLNTAITNKKYLEKMEMIKDKRVIFIFDECHRSQFGETHQRIKKFFTNCQMFGFTGTPIFEDNANKSKITKDKTTKDLFDKRLHSYLIKDAIFDENVLKFSVEYIKTFKAKDGYTDDILVEAIDTKEIFESDERANLIADYILSNHDRKTHSKDFNSIFCVSSIPMLVKYYNIFKKKNHDLKIAAIFSYLANEESGQIFEESDNTDDKIDIHSRDALEMCMKDYNKTFETNFTTRPAGTRANTYGEVRDPNGFYGYSNDISKRMKRGQIDLLIVVNMFLTGFDSKAVNTLYVDKNLEHHGLIQAFSRTNRILNEKKSQGNIVCFRNLKAATDKAIKLFSDKSAKETVLLDSYESYYTKFKEAVDNLFNIAPTVESVDILKSEEEQAEFVKRFRDLLRLRNIMQTFDDFDLDKLPITENVFEQYKSKYHDLYDKVKFDNSKEKVSILKDIDFELELIHRDEINVSYILKLLAQLMDMPSKEDKAKKRDEIKIKILNEPQLRSKVELIEEFIDKNLPSIDSSENIEKAFFTFLDDKKRQEFERLTKELNIDEEKARKIIDHYLFTQMDPLEKELFDMLNEKPSILKRKSIIDNVRISIKRYIETFIDGL